MFVIITVFSILSQFLLFVWASIAAHALQCTTVIGKNIVLYMTLFADYMKKTIQASGLPGDIENDDIISILESSRNGGGDVSELKRQPDGTLLVIFEAEDGNCGLLVYSVQTGLTGPTTEEPYFYVVYEQKMRLDNNLSDLSDSSYRNKLTDPV